MLKSVIFDIEGMFLSNDSSFSDDQIEGTKELILDLEQNDILLAVSPMSTKEAYETITENLHISPLECLVIVDSTAGCMAAAAANINCIGYLNSSLPNQDLSKAYLLFESFLNIDFSYLKNEHLRSHGLPVTIAVTERLIIRELSVDDITHMYQIYQNIEIKKYIDDIDEYLEVEIEKHIAYIKNIYAFYGFGLWGLFSKKDNTLIGRCGIQNTMIDGKNEIELSYLLDVNHWGKGYAVECTRAILAYCFNTLELQSIAAAIDTYNTKSIKVAERIGMSYEKELSYKDRICGLYRITLDSFNNNKRLQATKTAFQKINKSPDTTVYSRQYPNK